MMGVSLSVLTCVGCEWEGGESTCTEVSRTLSIDLSTCVLAKALASAPPSRDRGLEVASFDLGLLAISAAWKWSRCSVSMSQYERHCTVAEARFPLPPSPPCRPRHATRGVREAS